MIVPWLVLTTSRVSHHVYGSRVPGGGAISRGRQEAAGMVSHGTTHGLGCSSPPAPRCCVMVFVVLTALYVFAWCDCHSWEQIGKLAQDMATRQYKRVLTLSQIAADKNPPPFALGDIKERRHLKGQQWKRGSPLLFLAAGLL